MSYTITQDHYMYDSQASNNHPTLLGHCCDVDGYFGERKFLSDCHLHPLYHRYSSSKEGYFHGFCYPAYNEGMDVFTKGIQDDNAPNEEGIEECYMPYGDYSNWLGNYDLFSGDYWREASNCSTHDSYQGASASSWEETVYQGKCDEDFGNYVGYQEEPEYQPASVHDFWSSYQTWINYGEQEDPNNKAAQGHSYGSELRFCEDIFGYWPCLYQKMPHHEL